jgi:phosphoglycolate phosphatase-like HAD superfamily hydrolase
MTTHLLMATTGQVLSDVNRARAALQGYKPASESGFFARRGEHAGFVQPFDAAAKLEGKAEAAIRADNHSLASTLFVAAAREALKAKQYYETTTNGTGNPEHVAALDDLAISLALRGRAAVVPLRRDSPNRIVEFLSSSEFDATFVSCACARASSDYAELVQHDPAKVDTWYGSGAGSCTIANVWEGKAAHAAAYFENRGDLERAARYAVGNEKVRLTTKLITAELRAVSSMDPLPDGFKDRLTARFANLSYAAGGGEAGTKEAAKFAENRVDHVSTIPLKLMLLDIAIENFRKVGMSEKVSECEDNRLNLVSAAPRDRIIGIALRVESSELTMADSEPLLSACFVEISSIYGDGQRGAKQAAEDAENASHSPSNIELRILLLRFAIHYYRLAELDSEAQRCEITIADLEAKNQKIAFISLDALLSTPERMSVLFTETVRSSIPGMGEIISHLRNHGFRIFVTSSKDQQTAQSWLDQFGILADRVFSNVLVRPATRAPGVNYHALLTLEGMEHPSPRNLLIIGTGGDVSVSNFAHGDVIRDPPVMIVDHSLGRHSAAVLMPILDILLGRDEASILTRFDRLTAGQSASTRHSSRVVVSADSEEVLGSIEDIFTRMTRRNLGDTGEIGVLMGRVQVPGIDGMESNGSPMITVLSAPTSDSARVSLTLPHTP